MYPHPGSTRRRWRLFLNRPKGRRWVCFICLPAGPTGTSIVITTGWAFRLMTVITLTAGTAFIMWLGEQITEKGIGNGISLIIFAGIVVRGPEAIINTFRLPASGQMS